MNKPSNDDHDARVAAINRRALEIQAFMTQPGRTKAEGESAVAELRELVAELQQLSLDTSAELRALQRQLGISTRPNLTVVKDNR